MKDPTTAGSTMSMLESEANSNPSANTKRKWNNCDISIIYWRTICSSLRRMPSSYPVPANPHTPRTKKTLKNILKLPSKIKEILCSRSSSLKKLNPRTLKDASLEALMRIIPPNKSKSSVIHYSLKIPPSLNASLSSTILLMDALAV